MTEPILAEKVVGKGRMYRSPKTGELLPSVTNCIDVLAKPWLGAWAAKMVAGYAFDNRQALMGMSDREAAVDYLKGAPYRKRNAAAGLGDVIHSYVEATLTDQPLPEITEAHEPYLEGFRRFLAEFNPDFRIIEGTVFNHAEGYSGSFDFMAGIGDLLILGDWKSGSGIFDEVALQLAALRFADSVWDPATGDLLPMPPVDGCIAVHLQPGKCSVHVIDAGKSAFQTFLGLRRAWPWVKDNNAVGPVVNAARLFNEFSSGAAVCNPPPRSQGEGGPVAHAPAAGPAAPDEFSSAAETTGEGREQPVTAERMAVPSPAGDREVDGG